MKNISLNNRSKSRFSKNKIATALSLAAMSMGSSSGFAQNEAGFSLEEIVVTATRRESSLQQTAVAVSAFSTDALAEKGISNLQQLDGFVPSLSIGNRAGQGAGAGSITLRGIGVDGFESDGAVGTYIDDVYYGAQYGNLLGMMDLQRVEVLRGPQGTLFGRNTLAGAIQYISAQPDTEELSGYIKGVVGSDERQEVSFGVNVPVSDTFAFRVAGTTQEKDGFVKDERNNINLGSEENDAIRILAAWEPTDSLSANFKYERVESANNGRATIVVGYDNNALFPSIAAQTGVPPLDDSILATGFYSTPGTGQRESFEFEMDIYQATIDFDINDSLSLKSITAYQDYAYSLIQDLDSSVFNVLYSENPNTATSAFSQEFRLDGSGFNDRLTYTAGAFYYDDEVEDRDELAIGNAPANPSGDITKSVESFAIFGQGAIGLSDALTLTVGVRATSEDVIAEVATPMSTTTFESSYDETSPYVGVDYQFNDDKMVYAKYSEGFRAGGATANAGLPGGGVGFDQDTVTTAELGARLEFLDGRLRVNPTIYQTEWKDVQVNSVLNGQFGPVISTSNIGDADIQGLELETLFAATDALTLNLSISLLDAEYSRVEPYFQATYPNGVTFVNIPGVPAPVPTGEVIAQNLSLDSELNRAPELKYTFGGTYKHDLANGAEISSSLSYSYTDDQRSATADLDSIILEEYSVVNGRVQFTSPNDQWVVGVFGTNLTDEEYLIGGTAFASGYTVGVNTNDPARGRELGLDVQYNF